MFLKALRAEFIKHSRSFGTYLVLFGGSALFGYAIMAEIGSGMGIRSGLFLPVLMYLFPVWMAFVSDMLARPDAKNWPLLYTKNIRFQYVLAKFAHFSFLSFLGFLIFVGMASLPVVGSGFPKELVVSAAWFLWLVWLSYLPTLFIFSYVSNLSSVFLATMLSVLIFMVYPFARSYIVENKNPQFETIKEVAETVDAIVPTSLPWNFYSSIDPKEGNFLASDKCRHVIGIETPILKEDGGVVAEKKEICGYDEESLKNVFGFSITEFSKSVKTNGVWSALLYAWFASMVLLMIISYSHIREREAP